MELLERASELQALNSALGEVKAGEGCIALVYGEAGIGKTSLVKRFLSDKEKTWRILQGLCDLLFTPRPLGPLRDIALQTKGRLLRLLDSGGGQETLFSTCLTELKNQPSILLIEDIHWADEATLDLLKYLGRRIGQTPSLMILTYRDDEIGADSPMHLFLGDLASSHAVHRVPVSALSMEGVRGLVRDRNVDVAALHRLTDGNPFFVTEILAGEGAIPETVQEAVLARAARLSCPARAVLEAAAVSGLRVEPWLLSKLCGAEEAPIEECISRGILRWQAGYYAFRHELARDTMLDSIPPGRKAQLHKAVLAALEESPVTCRDLARLAHHAAGSGEAEAILEYAPAAARQAATAGAHREAAALYELALRFAEALPDARHAQMLEAYAGEHWFVGRRARLIPVRQEIIERYHARGDRLQEGVNLALLAIELHIDGKRAESDEAIRAAIAMLEVLPPSLQLAKARRVQSVLLMEQLEYMRGVAAAEQAIALAEHFGDMDVLARACQFAGEALLIMGDERGRTLMERSLAVAHEHGLQYATGLALCNWSGASVMTYQFEEAARLLQEGMAYTTEHGDDHHLGDLLDIQAEMQMHQGRWTEAAKHLEETLRQPEIEINSRISYLVTLGRLGVRRGDAGAKAMLDEALILSSRANSLEFVGGARAGLAEAAWLAGDGERIIEQARVAYDLFANQHIPWATGELAFWRWRAGEAFRPPEWIARPYALQIAGDWRGAAREWEQRGCPYEQGMALMDGDEAAQLRAFAIFDWLGARPILEKLKQNMRAAGIRGIPRGARPTTRENRYRFTAREMEVLGCVVKGLSNNAIARQLSLSVRTVEHHIAAMLQKTGAESRNELVVLAMKESVVPPA